MYFIQSFRNRFPFSETSGDIEVVSTTFCKMLYSLVFAFKMRSETAAADVVGMWITRRVIQVRWEGMAFHRTVFPQRVSACFRLNL